MTSPIDNTDDVIDSRDIIARIEDLQAEREAYAQDVTEAEEAFNAEEDKQKELDLWQDVLKARSALASWNEGNGEELRQLEELAEQCEGYGDWEHGETLIHRGYWIKYCQEFADDIGAVNHDLGWPNNHIDWEAAANELEQDYMSVDFDGQEYLKRAY